MTSLAGKHALVTGVGRGGGGGSSGAAITGRAMAVSGGQTW